MCMFIWLYKYATGMTPTVATVGILKMRLAFSKYEYKAVLNPAHRTSESNNVAMQGW